MEYHQESFYCSVPLAEQQYCFSSRSMAYLVSSSWLPKQCRVQIQFHGLGLKSSQSVVAYSHKFVPLLHQHISQVGHHCRSKALQLGRCLSFSSGSLQSTFLYQKNQSIGATAVIRQQLDFSMFNELCVGVFFSNRALPSVCGEHSRILAIAWVVLSISLGSLWLRSQLDITHSWHWKFQLIVRDVLGLCLSCYLVILFRFFSYMYIVYILRNFCCIRFSYHFSNGPQV